MSSTFLSRVRTVIVSLSLGRALVSLMRTFSTLMEEGKLRPNIKLTLLRGVWGRTDLQGFDLAIVTLGGILKEKRKG